MPDNNVSFSNKQIKQFNEMLSLLSEFVTDKYSPDIIYKKIVYDRSKVNYEVILERLLDSIQLKCVNTLKNIKPL